MNECPPIKGTLSKGKDRFPSIICQVRAVSFWGSSPHVIFFGENFGDFNDVYVQLQTDGESVW